MTCMLMHSSWIKKQDYFYSVCWIKANYYDSSPDTICLMHLADNGIPSLVNNMCNIAIHLSTKNNN